MGLKARALSGRGHEIWGPVARVACECTGNAGNPRERENSRRGLAVDRPIQGTRIPCAKSQIHRRQALVPWYDRRKPPDHDHAPERLPHMSRRGAAAASFCVLAGGRAGLLYAAAGRVHDHRARPGTQPYIIGLLAMLAMVGLLSMFAYAGEFIRFDDRSADDTSRRIADHAMPVGGHDPRGPCGLCQCGLPLVLTGDATGRTCARWNGSSSAIPTCPSGRLFRCSRRRAKQRPAGRSPHRRHRRAMAAR